MKKISASRFLTMAFFLAPVAVLSAPAFWAQNHVPQKRMGQGTAVGERVFTSTCANCHGLDGRGGERAPSIFPRGSALELSDNRISNIVKNGIPGTGMPSFPSLTASEVEAVVHYLRALQRKPESQTTPGDPARGKQVFVGRGECSNCHTVSGTGGFLGPDLSAYGLNLSAETIRSAILKPPKSQTGYKPASIVTREGERIEGVVRNEDNFSIQLITKRGSMYFLQKADLKSVAYSDQPLMPADYGKRLSPTELDDLVSYLMSARANTSQTTKPEMGED